MLTAFIVLRAYVLWAGLIGQAVIIGLFYLPATGDFIRSSPHSWWVMLVILAASGVVGLVGEWLWRTSREVTGADGKCG